MKRTHALFAFVGLTVLLTAGAAQSLSGSNTVFSDDIVDGQVKFADIKPDAVTSSRIRTDAVGASEIRAGQVGASEVNEESLVFPTAEGTDAVCLDDGVVGAEDCAAASLTLASAGKVWINVTYEFQSDPGVTNESGTVRLVVDGVVTESHAISDDANVNQYPMPIQDLVNLSAGNHTIKLTFQEGDDAEDVDIVKSHIVAVQVSA